MLRTSIGQKDVCCCESPQLNMPSNPLQELCTCTCQYLSYQLIAYHYDLCHRKHSYTPKFASMDINNSPCTYTTLYDIFDAVNLSTKLIHQCCQRLK